MRCYVRVSTPFQWSGKKQKTIFEDVNQNIVERCFSSLPNKRTLHVTSLQAGFLTSFVLTFHSFIVLSMDRS